MSEKRTVKAVVCEVFSRVCGFYRPVSAFNLGKKEEFKDRYTHDPEGIVKHFDEPKPVERH